MANKSCGLHYFAYASNRLQGDRRLEALSRDTNFGLMTALELDTEGRSVDEKLTYTKKVANHVVSLSTNKLMDASIVEAEAQTRCITTSLTDAFEAIKILKSDVAKMMELIGNTRAMRRNRRPQDIPEEIWRLSFSQSTQSTQSRWRRAEDGI